MKPHNTSEVMSQSEPGMLDGKERLFLRKTMSGLSMQDSKRNHIGWFKTEQEARNWCAENNYKLSIV